MLTVLIFFFSIIFVHGLRGDRERTWTAKDALSPWPQTLLPAETPQARILTFGYDANVANWRAMVSNNRIGDHARNLLSAVATYRENDDTVRSCPALRLLVRLSADFIRTPVLSSSSRIV